MRKMTTILLLAALALGLGPARAQAAENKSSGSEEMVVDLLFAPGGKALMGGGFRLQGAMGQFADRGLSLGGVETDNGFFSRIVSTGLTNFNGANLSTVAFSWNDPSPANPTGTLYRIEISTAMDFSGTITSTEVAGQNSAYISGLAEGTTYYARYRAALMDEETRYHVLGSTYMPVYCGPINAVSNGNWSSPSTWDKKVPTTCNDVNVNGLQVTVDDQTAQAQSLNVLAVSTVTFSRVKHTSLTVLNGDIDVANSGYLDMGNLGNPIPAGTSAYLFLPACGGGCSLDVAVGGRFSAHGALKSPHAFLTSNVQGATVDQLEVADEDAIGWNVGDAVVVAPDGAGNMGPGTSEVRQITGLSSAIGFTTVQLSAAIAPRGAVQSTAPVAVMNLTRNVVIESTDTNINRAYIESNTNVLFDIRYAEIIGLGQSTPGQEALQVGSNATLRLSSSSIRLSYDGLDLDGPDDLLIEGNVFFNNFGPAVFIKNFAHRNILYNNVFGSGDSRGIYIQNSTGTIIAGGAIHGFGDDGVFIQTNADDTLIANVKIHNNNAEAVQLDPGADNVHIADSLLHRNGGVGIEFNAVSNSLIDNVGIYNNSLGGALLNNAPHHTFYGVSIFENGNYGVDMDNNSNYVTFFESEIYTNVGSGLVYRNNSNNGSIANSELYFNAGHGVEIIGAQDVRLVETSVYGNLDVGIFVDDGRGEALASRLGFEEDGTLDANTSGEIDFDPSTARSEDFQLYETQLSSTVTPGVVLAGLNRQQTAVVAFNINFETGTLRFWGNSTVDSDVDLRHAGELQGATTSQFQQMRGDGGTNMAFCGITPSNAVSQLIVVQRTSGGDWDVAGSSTGYMGTLTPGAGTCASSSNFPSAAPQVALSLSESPNVKEGDLFQFMLHAGSRDQNAQKKALFGPSASAFHGGQSKIEVTTTGGWQMVGIDGVPTIMDMFPDGGTYYHFVSSGRFTAVRSSISNVAASGVQFGGNPTVMLSTMTFDFMGQSTIGGQKASYITTTDGINLTTTSYNLRFGLSRSTHGFINPANVRALTPNPSLVWTIRGEGVDYFGEGFDDDINFRVNWVDETCVSKTTIQSGPWSDPLTWQFNIVPAACTQIQINNGHVVTVDIPNATASTTTVFGTLSFPRVGVSSLTLVNGNMIVASGGVLDMGTEASPIPPSATAHLVLSYGPGAQHHNLTILAGGGFSVRGATKSVSGFATTGATGGGNTIQIAAADVQGWNIGDEIIVGPTSGNGVSSAERKTISAITGSDPKTIVIEGTWATGHTPTGAMPVIVGNLTRNVLVRSSGTQTGAGGDTAYINNLGNSATSFVLTHGEFAYLGVDFVAPRSGVFFNGGNSKGSISSSTFHSGLNGVDLFSSSGVVVIGSILADNAAYGMTLSGNADDVTFYGGIIARNASDGFYADDSFDIYMRDSHIFSNGNRGVQLSNNSKSALFRGNYVYANAADGMQPDNDSSIQQNRFYLNFDHGVDVFQRVNISFIQNLFFNNGDSGVFVHTSSAVFLSGNESFGNGDYGYEMEDSEGVAFIEETVLSNTLGGFLLNGSSDVIVLNSRIGYDNDGTAAANSGSEIIMQAGGSGEQLDLKDTQVNPASGNDLSGLDGIGKYLISYNQDFATGTVKLWGDYEISTMTLVYAQDLYSPSTSTIRLMRGTGHTAQVCSFNSTNLVSQLVWAEYSADDTEWLIYGSSTGFMGTVSTGGSCPAGTLIPSGAGEQFRIVITEAAPNDRDRFDFGVIGPSRDSNVQKKLLMGFSDTLFNSGRARIRGNQSSFFDLRGDPAGGNPTIVDKLAAGGTFYSFVASGTFRALHSSFTNMDHNGIVLTAPGNKISLSSSSFDYIANISTVNFYLTFSPTTLFAGTSTDVSFGTSRAPQIGDHNVRLVGFPTGIGWTFNGTSFNRGGGLWGPAFEQETANKIGWQTCDPIESAGSGTWSSPAIWSPKIEPTYCNEVTISTGNIVTATGTVISSTLSVYGHLSFSRVDHSSLNVRGDITIYPPGHLDMGTAASPILGSSATLILGHNNSLTVQAGGDFTTHGAPKDPYAFAVNVIAGGGTSASVSASSTTGWGIGDIITMSHTVGWGKSRVSTHSITSIFGVDPQVVQFSPGAPGVGNRVPSSTTPIVVANLSRNVRVQSSSLTTTGAGRNTAYIRSFAPNATSFSLINSEFIGLGDDLNNDHAGIKIEGPSGVAEISTSVFRHGHFGLYYAGTSQPRVTSSIFYQNTADGLHINNSDRALIINSIFAKNEVFGLRLAVASDYAQVLDSFFFNNTSGLLFDGNANGHNVEDSHIFSHDLNGLQWAPSAHRNLVFNNNVYSNGLVGVSVFGASSTTIAGNRIFFNNQAGIQLSNGAERTVVVDNKIYGNTSNGVNSADANHNFFIHNNYWANVAYSLRFDQSTGTIVAGDTLGFDNSGAANPSLNGEIDFATTGETENLVLLNANVHTSSGIRREGFNQEGNFLLSYTQSYSTGQLNIIGDYQVRGATLTLDHATRLYGSSATPVRLMRGNGHTGEICQVYGNNAKTQGVFIEYNGSTWDVLSDAGGFLGTINGDGSCNDIPAGTPQFELKVTEGAPIKFDRLEAAIFARSPDANTRKLLIFGSGADGFRQARSKLSIAESGGISLIGTSDQPTLIGKMNGATYYTFVDSGAFTVQYASFTNADSHGIQLTGGGQVQISSTSFDFLGYGATTNSYLTLRDFKGNLTFDNVRFGLSRAEVGLEATNIAIEGDDSNVDIFMTTPRGVRWGESFDLDPSRKVGWETCQPLTSVQSGNWSDGTTWDLEVAPRYCNAVNIAAGHTVNIATTTAQASTTTIAGILSFDRTVHSSFTLISGDLVVVAGGQLDMGTPASPILEGTTAHLVLAAGAGGVNYGLHIASAGRFTAWGATKTYASVATAVGGGDLTTAMNSMQLASNPIGWKVGDQLAIAPTGRNSGINRRTIVTIAANIITLNANFSAVRYASETIHVANLSRNVLVRSSVAVVNTGNSFVLSVATVTQALQIGYTEFAYLGYNISKRKGFTLDAFEATIDMSSSVIRDAYKGMEVLNHTSASVQTLRNNLFVITAAGQAAYDYSGGIATSITLDGNHAIAAGAGGFDISGLPGTSPSQIHNNLAYANNGDGMRLQLVSRSSFTNNHFFANASGGSMNGGLNNDFSNLRVTHNNGIGWSMNNISSSNFVGGEAYGNASDGMRLINSGVNRFDGFDSDLNAGHGYLVFQSNEVLIMNARVNANNDDGVQVNNSHGTFLFNLDITDNSDGVDANSSSSQTRVYETHSYANFIDLSIDNGQEVQWISGTLGYDPAGSPAPATNSELLINPLAQGFGLLVNTRLNPTPGIDVNGLVENNFVASINAQNIPGRLELHGDLSFQVGDSLSLNNATDFDGASTNTVTTMRGINGISNMDVCSLNNANAITQVVELIYNGANWDVIGSSSGVMGTVAGGGAACPTGTNIPAAGTQFAIKIFENSPVVGDRIIFGLEAGTKDAGFQKQLRVGPAAPAFNQGRSVIKIPAGTTFELIGDAATPALLGMLETGSTYFTFVVSGTLNVAHASITNMDPNGLQLYGAQAGFSIALSSTVFDYIGIGDQNTASYISLREELPGNATFYGLTFGLGRSTHGLVGAYNFNAPLLQSEHKYFRRSSGALAGEQFDLDFSPDQFLTVWFPTTPVNGGQGNVFNLGTSSLTVRWVDIGNDEDSNYRLEIAEDQSFGTVVASSVTGTIPFGASTATVVGLKANTTQYLRVVPFEGSFSGDPLFIGFGSTLAELPFLQPDPFLAILADSATITWGALAPAPQEQSSEGYVLRASTLADFSDPSVIFDATSTSVALTTLTLSGMLPNTTYFFEVGSLNWENEAHFTLAGTTATLAKAVVDPQISKVYVTSVAINWKAVPTVPQEDTAEGFIVEASTTPLFEQNFGTVILSSVSYGVGQSTLTISGLSAYVTYYFRVGALNWNFVSSYTVLGTTIPKIFTIDPIGLNSTRDTWGATFGDQERDGDLDVLFAATSSNDKYVADNDGSGSFSNINVIDVSNTHDGAWGDYDGDGDLDVALANSNTNDKIYRNDGGSFTDTAALTGTNVTSEKAAWADYDGDGDLDLVVAVSAGGNSYIARQDAGGTFTQVGLGFTAHAVAWGDFDNDGDADLVFGRGSGSHRVLENLGDNDQFATINLTGSINNARDVVWADLDADGDLDIAMARTGSNDDVLFRNNGSGTFSNAQTITNSGGNSFAIAAADFEGDGDIDLVIGKLNGGQSRLAINDGAGGFTIVSMGGSNTGSNDVRGIAWGDYDEDGDLDIAVPGSSSVDDYILRNDAQFVNAAPSQPTLSLSNVALNYDVTRSTLTIGWPAGDYDSRSDSDTVHYSLVIATAPMILGNANRDVISPDQFYYAPDRASPLLGNQLRAGYDGATDRHFARFHLDEPGGRLLSDTTLYIRVQSVDQGLERSPWSTEIATHVFVANPPNMRQLTAFYSSSMTVRVSPTPGMTQMRVEASVNANFIPIAASSVTTAMVLQDLSVLGLSPNTTYYLRAGGQYQSNIAYGAATPASQSTLAVFPGPVGNAFPLISSSTLSVLWSHNGNPVGTTYEVTITTAGAFEGSEPLTITFSTTPAGTQPQASFTGLAANTTYSLHVGAFNHASIGTGFTGLQATMTYQAPPQSVYFDHVSSDTIIISAYAPTPNFRNLHVGQSATNIAIDNSYQGWQGSTWTLLTPMPLPASELAVAGHPSSPFLYTIGGTSGGHLSTVRTYNVISDIWASTTSLSAPRSALAADTIAGGKTYAIGGFDGGFVNRTESYDFNTALWTTENVLPNGRRRLMAASVDGLLYAIGGDDVAPALSDTDVFDPATGLWSTNPTDMTTARRAGTAVAYNRNIYVFGGNNGSNDLGTVESFDPNNGANGTWSGHSAMLFPVDETAAATMGGKIYVIGGDAAGVKTGAVQEYDPSNDTWVARFAATTARSRHGAVTRADRIYVAGGHNGAVELATMESYEPGTTHILSGLAPNSFHQFKAKARNAYGIETSETLNVSTFTHAARPVSAAGGDFLGVGITSVTVQFNEANNSGSTEFRVQAATAADFSDTVFPADSGFTDPGGGPVLVQSLTGLQGNVTYYFRVQARNGFNIETDFLVLNSTITNVNPPTTVATTFTFVGVSSMTIAWGDNGNGAGTLYEAILSTASPLVLSHTGNRSTRTAPSGPFTADVGIEAALPLASNTTYFAFVRAFNGSGAATPFVALGSSVTLPNTPAFTSPAFLVVGNTSVMVQWDINGNAVNQTTYTVILSTSNQAPAARPFDIVVTTAPTGNPAAAEATGLKANATYYLHVAAVNHTGAQSPFALLGSSVTNPGNIAGAIPTYLNFGISSMTVAWNGADNAPESLYEITLSTTVSTQPGGGAQDVTVSTTSGDGLGGTIFADFPLGSLTSNTTYAAYVRVIARDDAEPGVYNNFSGTMTLAALPQLFVPAFPSVGQLTLDAQWATNNPNHTWFETVLSTTNPLELGAGDNVAIATQPSGVPLVTYPGLTANTTQFLYVRAVSGRGTFTDYVAIDSTSTLTIIPAPGFPQYVNVATAGFTVNWNASNPLARTLYNLQISTAVDFSGSADIMQSTLPVSGNSFTPSGLSPNTTYYVQVEAVNNDGVSSAYTSLGSTATLPNAPLSAASTFSALTTNGFSVLWDDDGNPAGDTLYQIEASTASGFGGASAVVTATYPVSGPMTTFNTLNANTTYYVRARAFSRGGGATAYTNLGSTPTLSFQVVSGLFADVGASSATLTWSPNGNPAGQTLYQVRMSTTPDVPSTAPADVILSTRPTGATAGAEITGLAGNTTVYLTIEALNHSGASAGLFGIIDSTVTQAATPVTVASTFTSVLTTTMTVQWASGGNSTGTYYEATLSTDTTFSPLSTENRSSTTLNTSVNIENLSGNTTYYLRVRAFNAFNVPSPYALLGSTPTLPNPPTAVTTAFPEVGIDSATVQWAHNGNGQDVTRYQVILTTVAGGPPSPPAPADSILVSTTPQGVQPAAELSGLLANATYYLHVAAVGHSGNLTAFQQLGSTFTAVTVPASAVSTFTFVSSDTAIVEFNSGGNAFDTFYEAVLSTAGSPPNGSAGDVLVQTVTTSTFHTPLVPNSVYTLSVRAMRRNGEFSPFVNLGSTLTPVAAPLPDALPFQNVSTDSFSGHWLANGNPNHTTYDTVVSTESPLVLTHTGNIAISTQPSAALTTSYANLAPNASYFLFVRAVDQVGGGATAYVPMGSTATLADTPVLLSGAATSFIQVNFNAIHFTWDPVGNPTGTVYVAELSQNAGFVPLDRSSITLSTTVIFGRNGQLPNLTNETTYYLRVKAVNFRGVASPYAVAGATITPVGDLVPPTIGANPPSSSIWRVFPGSETYALSFADTGGADLDRFQIDVWTGPGQTGTNVLPFTNNGTGINAPTFNTPWTILPANFAALANETTNYVTVRVFDQNNNSTDRIDSFFVLKDTSGPQFVNGELGGDLVPQSAVGKTYNVDTIDIGSGIDAFQYSVSTNTGGGADLITWTNIVLPAGATEYVTDWTVNFPALVEGTTNYVSVRAWDLAGTTNTSVDAFFVLKDTSGPIVEITSPTAAAVFVSSLGIVQGTAQDLLGVKHSSVSIKDVASGFYWDGTAFGGVTPIFWKAVGTNQWVLDITTVVPAFVEGQAYQFVALSVDLADNFSVVYATKQVTYDTTDPTASVTFPVAGTTRQLPLATITGTSADSGSGIASLEVRLQRASDNLYWNWFTDTFQVAPVVTVPAGISPWSVTPSALLLANLRDGASYYVEVRASDSAVPPNQNLFAATQSSFTWLDNTAPAAIADLSGLQGANPGEIQLTWTTPGDDGALGTILLGEYRIDHSTFVPIVFSTTAADLIISTTLVAPGVVHSTTIVGLTPDTTYFVTIFTQDDEGQWSALSNPATALATPTPFLRIDGHVRKVSSEGITAVLVEAYDTGNNLVSSTFTVADGSGSYQLSNVSPGNYRIQASWTVGDITSSVWLDGVAMGSVNVDFRLEINVALATVQGTMLTLGTGGGASGSFMSVAQASGFKSSFIELHKGGRMAVQVVVGSDGKWRIPNLLPGKYSVRGFNGLEYTQLQEITLLEGEVKNVGFVFDPLPVESVFAFPNPARSGTTIRFITGLFPFEGNVRIFDIAGQLVREIPGGELSSPSPGLYHAVWDLKNNNGQDVASGVYLFIVKVKGANGQTAKVVKKVAVVR
jgi:hypothetical protein